MVAERWVPAAGCEDKYEVSSLGRVRSLGYEITLPNGRVRRIRARLLRPGVHKRARYPRVTLRGRRALPVHHLVLESFVGPRPAGMQALHRNDNPLDNRLENLYWGTPRDNDRDKARNSGYYQLKREVCRYGHPLDGVSIVNRRGGTQRFCRTCHNAVVRANYRKKKACHV